MASTKNTHVPRHYDFNTTEFAMQIKKKGKGRDGILHQTMGTVTNFPLEDGKTQTSMTNDMFCRTGRDHIAL